MASKFWVGGTGTWDNSTTTHWATSTGGAGGAAVPTTGDSVTFDGASGGGVVSVAASVSGLSLINLTMGAFTGTLDFSVGNPNLTITAQFSISGAGTRTLHLGSGTFTLNPTGGNNTPWFAATTTGLTFDAGTSTFALVSSQASVSNHTFAGGGLSYQNLTFSVSGAPQVPFNVTGTNTFNNIAVTGPAMIQWPPGTTTITTAYTLTGTAAAPIIFMPNNTNGAVPTLSTASGTVSISFGVLQGITFGGGAAFTAPNSFDAGGNSGITITAPSGGGGGVIIGG
jgi:hypothetical protein